MHNIDFVIYADDNIRYKVGDNIQNVVLAIENDLETMYVVSWQ